MFLRSLSLRQSFKLILKTSLAKTVQKKLLATKLVKKVYLTICLKNFSLNLEKILH